MAGRLFDVSSREAIRLAGIKVLHLAGRLCVERSEDGPLVNNSASGACMLVFFVVCVVATCVVSRVLVHVGHIASCCK